MNCGRVALAQEGPPACAAPPWAFGAMAEEEEAASGGEMSATSHLESMLAGLRQRSPRGEEAPKSPPWDSFLEMADAFAEELAKPRPPSPPPNPRMPEEPALTTRSVAAAPKHVEVAATGAHVAQEPEPEPEEVVPPWRRGPSRDAPKQRDPRKILDAMPKAMPKAKPTTNPKTWSKAAPKASPSGPIPPATPPPLHLMQAAPGPAGVPPVVVPKVVPPLIRPPPQPGEERPKKMSRGWRGGKNLAHHCELWWDPNRGSAGNEWKIQQEQEMARIKATAKVVPPTVKPAPAKGSTAKGSTAKGSTPSGWT